MRIMPDVVRLLSGHALGLAGKGRDVRKSEAMMRLRFCLMLGMTALSACGQKDAVENFSDLTHDLQGGVIAGPLLPPPGFDKPYPKVGRVPRHTVTFPSTEARKTLSEKLIEQRNDAQYLAVRDGSLVLDPIPPSPSASRNARRQSGQLGNSGQAASSTMPVASPEAPRTAQTQDATHDDLPQVTRFAPPPITAGETPPIPDAPPPPPVFAGFAIPDTKFVIPPLPQSFRADPPGGLVQFQATSDVLDMEGQKSINRLKGQHLFGQVMRITGHGDAVSFSLTDQMAAMNLAILRAKRVGEAFMRLGIPAREIRLAATPLGHGARVEQSGG
ncbi:hypothetical protein N5W20_07300 [Candidatus Kirkpatrickella diaphorinae]|uniref:Uncharacterized protein n=1 Tax=Candidatus Kirkpatrickella diaphorinae TaxID=2984322 RepID=A0ABY6GHB1_9PROT|nr:hypothetical protein [Candidatus Kirkpatrickella diaphorinae]UYH50906.1 hypothetical protein N5W20_07300 [Candidatus Kirkpatrickella diaphorinae]